MNNIEQVEPYKSRISEEALSKWDGVVRVWSEPKSIIDGAEVVDELRQPLEVTVVVEQKDVYGSLTQRVKIQYDNGREGWVLYDALVVDDKDD